MQIPFLAEVVESGNLTYNENPFSMEGKVLPAGSVRIRPLVNDRRGNVSLTYARPMTLNIGNIPLVGEHVMVFPGLSIDQSIGDFRTTTYYYFPFALNATDDAVINQLPDYDYRTTSPDTKGGGGGGGVSGAVGSVGRSVVGGIISGAIGGGISGAINGGANALASGAAGALKSAINNLPISPGATFPKPVRPIRPLQWYEGDSVFQNRSGSSLRLGSGTSQHPQYASQPDFHATPDRGSPLFAMVCDEPNGGKPRPLVEIPAAVKALLNFPGLKKLSQKFRTEDPRRVKVGFYGGIGLQLANIIEARLCYSNPIRRLKVLGETLPVPSFRGSQIVSDSDRVVMNAKRDNIIGLARKRIILEASKIILITNEHTVDLDDLVNDVQKLAAEVANLTLGMYPFATPVGPTGPSVGALTFKGISVNLNRLNSFPCAAPTLPTPPAPPEADFGVNITTAPYGEFSITGPAFSPGAAGGSTPPNFNPDPSENNTNGAPATIIGPNSTDNFLGSGTSGVLTGGSGTPLPGESGVGGSTGVGTGTGQGSGSTTGGSSNGTGPGTGGGGGGAGGGGTSPANCEIMLHLVDDNQLGWRDSKLQILSKEGSKERIIAEYSSNTASTLYNITVQQGASISFKFISGSDTSTTSYVIAAGSSILFSNGVCPDESLSYEYKCGAVNVAKVASTVVSFGDTDETGYSVLFFEFKVTRSSKTTLVRGDIKIILALLTSSPQHRGWYIVRGNPADFFPSEHCLVSKDILADNIVLANRVQKVNNDDNFTYVGATMKKIPYVLTLKA